MSRVLHTARRRAFRPSRVKTRLWLNTRVESAWRAALRRAKKSPQTKTGRAFEARRLFLEATEKDGDAGLPQRVGERVFGFVVGVCIDVDFGHEPDSIGESERESHHETDVET